MEVVDAILVVLKHLADPHGPDDVVDQLHGGRFMDKTLFVSVQALADWTISLDSNPGSGNGDDVDGDGDVDDTGSSNWSFLRRLNIILRRRCQKIAMSSLRYTVTRKRC